MEGRQRRSFTDDYKRQAMDLSAGFSTARYVAARACPCPQPEHISVLHRSSPLFGVPCNAAL
jgi:hypothetical protein